MSWLAKAGDWLDSRTGYRALVHHALDEPVPGGARWAYVFGSALSAASRCRRSPGGRSWPTTRPATTAWASVEHITYGVSRAAGSCAGCTTSARRPWWSCLALHLAQVALYGAYKTPREVNWWFGLGLLGVTLGFALTGYLLPWDQKGYWATRVATNIAGTIPVVGDADRSSCCRAGRVRQPHAHALLRAPRRHAARAARRASSVAHVALFRKHGVTPPARADFTRVDPFFPEQLAQGRRRGARASSRSSSRSPCASTALRSMRPPIPSSDYPARPEWYFLALFQLLKYFHGPLEIVGTVVLPGVLGRVPLRASVSFNREHGARTALGPLVPLALMPRAAVVALTLLAMHQDANDAALPEGAREGRRAREHRHSYRAKKGVPPEGPLAMMRRDPDLRGPGALRQALRELPPARPHGPDSREGHRARFERMGNAGVGDVDARRSDAAHRFGRRPTRARCFRWCSRLQAQPGPVTCPEAQSQEGERCTAPGDRSGERHIQAHAGRRPQSHRRISRRRSGRGERRSARRGGREAHRPTLHLLSLVPRSD